MGPGTGKEEGHLWIKCIDQEPVACSLDELSRSPPPSLPGGYTIGEKLYYTGGSLECNFVSDGARHCHN